MRILTISVLLSAILFQGCATGPLKSELKDIRQVNAPKLAKLKIGMPLEEFQAVFPEAYPAGQNGDTTGYESRLEQKYIDDADWAGRPLDKALGFVPPRKRVDVQVLWFYFYTDRLVKWGRPNDWPERPDKILEIRQR
jgi:hypothetical protein